MIYIYAYVYGYTYTYKHLHIYMVGHAMKIEGEWDSICDINESEKPN